MDTEKYNKVKVRLEQHLSEALVNLPIYDWFMIAVNGSYNYGMDTEHSDTDSKLLVIPSLEQLVSGRRINELYCMKDNGEHVEVKDIRNYFDVMLKQNVNFVETLYAQVWIINPKYMDLFSVLFNMHLEDLRPFEEDYARLAADVRDILDMLAFKIIKRAISKEYNG